MNDQYLPQVSAPAVDTHLWSTYKRSPLQSNEPTSSTPDNLVSSA